MLHHIEINVANLRQAIPFWEWLFERLGYTPYQSWEKGISWKQGQTYIVFVQTEEPYLDVPYHRKRSGLNHLAFYAASRAFVDELTEELDRRGVPVLYRDRHPFAGGEGHYAVFFEGPERMKLEVVASDS